MAKRNSIISVIIPVYNGEQYIEQCISSVQKQSIKDIEIIVINDGSEDNTLAICKKMQQKDPRITIITKKNEGVSAARNDGIAKANGEFIAFVDADDYVGPDIYAPLLHDMHKHNADVCLSNLFIDCDNKISNRTIFPREMLLKGQDEITKKLITLMLGDSALGIRDAILGYLFFSLYRGSFIRKYDLCFDTSLRIGEDLLFNLQFLRHANCCVCVNHSGYFYRQTTSSATRGNCTELWKKFQVLHLKKRKFLSNNHLAGRSIELRVACSFVESALISIENEVISGTTISIIDKTRRIDRICSDAEVQEVVRMIPLLKTVPRLLIPLILLRYPCPAKSLMIIIYYNILNYYRKLRKSFR
jgi:glycosyltransferase EpsH